MTKVYVVMGATGWVDDGYTEWPVVAYFNEQAANEHAAKAEALAKEIYPRWEWRGDSFVQVMSGVNEYDPNMQKYGVTTYTVYGVVVADAGTQPGTGNGE